MMNQIAKEMNIRTSYNLSEIYTIAYIYLSVVLVAVDNDLVKVK